MNAYGKIYLVCLLIMVSLIESCKKDNGKVFDRENPDAELYVKLAKEGNCPSLFVPNFKPSDIDVLLKYANDFSLIQSFAYDANLSQIPDSFKLGECMLWTIESIRLHYPNSNAWERYASALPRLCKKGTNNLCYRLNILELQDVYERYANWWNQNRNLDFEIARAIYPLLGLNYSWE